MKAIADSGYTFAGWSDGVTTALRREVSIDENITVSATFVEKTGYTIAYVAGANGSISGEASQTVYEGESGTIVTAVADEGYIFDQWDDGLQTASRYESAVSDDVSLTAAFVVETPEEPATYNIVFTAGVGGTISGDADQDVAPGANTTRVTAVPDPGYTFADWSDGYPAPSRIVCNVHAVFSAEASFAEHEYVLKYSTCRHGNIVGDAVQEVASGGSGTAVECVPLPGYHFVRGVMECSQRHAQTSE